MKISWQSLAHWLPFVFAAYLCYSALWRLAASDTRVWEPAFYAFLPICFLFVGMLTLRMRREIRELRESVATLRAGGSSGDAAA